MWSKRFTCGKKKLPVVKKIYICGKKNLPVVKWYLPLVVDLKRY
jgi:hypothetical protein